MADNTDWFADVAAVLDDSTDTALDAEPTSLETDSTPENDDESPAEDAPETDDALAAEVEESTEEDEEPAESVADQPAPTAPNWDSPDNPHYVKAQQLDSVQAQARAIVEKAATERAQRLQAERIKALADDDPQRITELQHFVTEAQAPLLRRAQELENEVEVAAKLATVVEEAVRLSIPADLQGKVFAEVERMMALPGGPDFLKRDIETRQADRRAFEDANAKLVQQVELLKKQLASRTILAERAERGADVVDSGSGNGLSFAARYDAASGEEAIDIILDNLVPR